MESQQLSVADCASGVNAVGASRLSTKSPMVPHELSGRPDALLRLRAGVQGQSQMLRIFPEGPCPLRRDIGLYSASQGCDLVCRQSDTAKPAIWGLRSQASHNGTSRALTPLASTRSRSRDPNYCGFFGSVWARLVNDAASDGWPGSFGPGWWTMQHPMVGLASLGQAGGRCSSDGWFWFALTKKTRRLDAAERAPVDPRISGSLFDWKMLRLARNGWGAVPPVRL